jgi:hypothetical protein
MKGRRFLVHSAVNINDDETLNAYTYLGSISPKFYARIWANILAPKKFKPKM